MKAAWNRKGNGLQQLTNELIEREETSNDEEEPTTRDRNFGGWLSFRRGRAEPQPALVSSAGQ
jgi:hypothetical protein